MGNVINEYVIYKPQKSAVWKKGLVSLIRWDRPVGASPLVSIDLINYGKPVTILVIRDLTPNDEEYSWIIPKTLNPGRYRIRIKDKEKNKVGISAIFVSAK